MAPTRPSLDDADGLSSPSFHEALQFWFKPGCIRFGGPAGQQTIIRVLLAAATLGLRVTLRR